MAQNITLLGADYPDVPAVTLPITGGGTATFSDTRSVTYNLSGGATASVTPSEVVTGQGFSVKLTAPTGYNLNNVSITMGGVDITEQVFEYDEGGGGSSEVYLGATPITLTQDASITLKGSSSVSYSYNATDKTFDDRENVTYQNVTFSENSAYYEVASNGGSVWYSRYMNMEFTGLQVGKSYTFTIVPYDTTLSEATGGYWALSDSNDTNITYINVETSTETYTWTATTSTVKVMLLPTASTYESLGKARFVSFTISSSVSGTFSDEQTLGLLTSGTTITSSPSCGVYAVTGGGGANLQTKSVSYTPTTSTQSAQVTADSGYDGLEQVNVSVGAIPSEYIVPSGTKSITANGTGIDVTSYASVDVAVPTGGTTKNIQVYSGYDETNSNTYVATDVSITVSKAGSYKCSWTGLRNTTSGTSGSQLYKNDSAVGSAHASGWIRSYGQYCEETLTLAAGDVLTIYARARASNYYMVVGNLIIQEQ